MMKMVLQRGVFSFCISAVCGLITNLLIEIIVRFISGAKDFVPLSPEYMSLFPSETIAMEVNILLYGVIGFAFSVAAIIYEKERIGFLFQNLLYFLITGMVWVPIVIFVWRLNRYPQALIGTLSGFVVTYVIMTMVGYRIVRKNISEINMCLADRL